MNNETWAIISIDRKLGEKFNDIDIDYPTLINYMHERGFSDDETAKTSIWISSGLDDENPRTFGYYDTGTKRIVLFPLSNMRFDENDSNSEDDNEKPREIFASDFSDRFSRTLIHELEHRAIDILDDDVRAKVLTVHAGRIALGGLMIGSASLAGSLTLLEKINERADLSSVSTNGFLSAGFALAVLYTFIKSRAFEDLRYLVSPEETTCNEAEERTPGNLVRITPRIE